ncbi:MAG: alpha/beta hydrolase [Chloroflexota bacterium]
MKVNDLELNVKISGTGIPFIWAHGLMGSMSLDDMTPWFKWDQLTDTINLVRYDARGHGQSEASYTPEDYHWFNLARDMLALADQVGFDQFVVGGQSMGCATSIYAALAAPERLNGLVLMNPPTAWETRDAQSSVYDQMADLIDVKGIDFLIGLMQQQPMVPAWQLEAFPNTNTSFADYLKSFNPKALAQILRGAKLCNLPPREDLRVLKMPALILAWVDDPTHPLSSAEELARLLPNSRLVIGKNAAEVATWMQQIREFVTSL